MRGIGLFLTLSLISGIAKDSLYGQVNLPQWPPAEAPEVDLSFMLQKPAGKGGFLSVRNGHLATPDGKRFRIWGINLTAGATVPTKEESPHYVQYLAQRGINCVRFHFLDLPAPRGIIDGSLQHTRNFNPETLDRFDFFVAELKKEGIYSNLNLNVGRTYRAGDGVHDWEYLGYAKGLTYFDERLIELQKEYARTLLTHYNPYTGSYYRFEPAVAIIEFVNENSIVESWFTGRLVGENQIKNPGTWTDITQDYAEELTRRYNLWLVKNLKQEELKRLREEAGVEPGADIPRLRPEQFGEASENRFRTECSFYMELESRYFWMMKKFLQEEIGVRSLLVGTSDHNHGRTGYPLLASTRQLDIVDGHTYWQHPAYAGDPELGKSTGFWIPNTAMVDDPFNSTVVELSRSAVAGKPYIVSEVNHPFPNRYASEGIPVLTAYGLFQDWDGIFWYTLEHDLPARWENRMDGHFDLAPDPIKMSQLASGALTFLRSDIKKARKVVPRGYSRKEIRESIRLSGQMRPYFTPGFSSAQPLLYGTRIVSFEQSVTGYGGVQEGSPLISDTGELKWFFSEKGEGLVTVESLKTQAIVGHMRQPYRLSHLAVDLEIDFAAVTLASMDGKVLGQSARILLNVATSVFNSGMKWNSDRTSLKSWGEQPIRVSPISGTVIVRGLCGVQSLEVMPLDSRGEGLQGPFGAVPSKDGWRIELEAADTPWYLLRVIR